jgi:hypothetical protein
MQDFEELNTKFFTEVTKAVNALVDSKVAVHAHDKILDDQVDDFKERLVSLLSPLFLTFLLSDHNRWEHLCSPARE